MPARRWAIDYDSVPPPLLWTRRIRRAEDLTPGGDHRHFVLGRAALLWLCRALGWGPGDRVLLPAFTCSSLVDPFVAEGVTVDFYELGDDLSVDMDDLRKRLPGARGGVVVHAFGWPQPVEVRTWLSTRSPDDGYWIEDVSHALFTRTSDGLMGRGGDATLTSYRKLIPCADGCALAFARGVPPGPRGHEAATRYRSHALVRYARMLLAGALGGTYRRRGALLRWVDLKTRDLRTREPIQVGEMNPVSRMIVERFDVERAKVARRRNALTLLGALSELGAVQPIWADVPEGVVPFVLPVRVLNGRRDDVFAQLGRNGVEAQILWRPLRQQAPGEHPVSDRLRAEIVCLPVDERYDNSDMQRIAGIMRAAVIETATISAAEGRSPRIAVSR